MISFLLVWWTVDQLRTFHFLAFSDSKDCDSVLVCTFCLYHYKIFQRVFFVVFFNNFVTQVQLSYDNIGYTNNWRLHPRLYVIRRLIIIISLIFHTTNFKSYFNRWKNDKIYCSRETVIVKLQFFEIINWVHNEDIEWYLIRWPKRNWKGSSRLYRLNEELNRPLECDRLQVGNQWAR